MQPILLLAALHVPQSPPPAPEAGATLDRVVQIVNEDSLTSLTFLRAMRMENDWKPFANENEFRRSEQRVRDNSVRYALKIQGGQDMGLDPNEIERRTKSFVDDTRERMGAAEFAEMLHKRSITLFEYHEWVKDQIFSRFWENYVTGSGSLGQARQSRDRYVRPGYIGFRYRECVGHEELLPEIGGSGRRVVVQQLLIDPNAAGAPDASGAALTSRALAEDLRARIAGGEDMSELVDRYGASKANHGISDPPFLEARLAKLDPALAAFVAASEPGALSEVEEFRIKDKTFWRVVRFLERRPAVVPDFASVEVQKKLEEGVKTYLSEWRLDQALKTSFRSSYVWTPNETDR